jgi:hypothetical protein
MATSNLRRARVISTEVRSMRKLELSLAVAAGFLGGALSHYVCSPLVHAQAQVLAPKEVRSQSFVLTDDKGAVQGVFTFEKPQGGSATIVLRGQPWPSNLEGWRPRDRAAREFDEPEISRRRESGCRQVPGVACCRSESTDAGNSMRRVRRASERRAPARKNRTAGTSHAVSSHPHRLPDLVPRATGTHGRLFL